MTKGKKLLISLVIVILSILPLAYSTSSNAATARFIIKGDLEYSIITGEKIQLYLNTKKNVKWVSSNKKIATVSNKGVVKGKKKGDVKITATVGKKKYTCTVSVWDSEELTKSMDYAPQSNRESEIDPDAIYVFEEDTKDADKKGNSKSNDDELNERIADILKNGTASSTRDKEVKDNVYNAYREFCKTWISEETLKEDYNLYPYWPFDGNIYFKDRKSMSTVFYTIHNIPMNPTNCEELESDGIRYQYVKHFEYKGESLSVIQLFFNIEDLKNVGLIK